MISSKCALTLLGLFVCSLIWSQLENYVPSLT